MQTNSPYQDLTAVTCSFIRRSSLLAFSSVAIKQRESSSLSNRVVSKTIYYYWEIIFTNINDSITIENGKRLEIVRKSSSKQIASTVN